MDETELLVQRQIDWLQDASPDDWHRLAYDYNWNEPLDPLFWIVCQPECDKATALLIFWKGEPTGYDYEDEEEKMGDDSYAVAPMLRHIVDRFNTTGYTRSEIAYDFVEDHGGRLDPEYDSIVEAMRPNDIQALVERGKAFSNPNVRIHPDLMVLNIAGRKVGGYSEGESHNRFPQNIARSGVESAGQFDGEPSGNQESNPYFSAPDGSNNDASARVRAVRRQSDTDAEGLTDKGASSSFLNGVKRLFGR